MALTFFSSSKDVSAYVHIVQVGFVTISRHPKGQCTEGILIYLVKAWIVNPTAD